MHLSEEQIYRLVRSNRLEEGRFFVDGKFTTPTKTLTDVGLITVKGRTHQLNDDFLHISQNINFQDEIYTLLAVYDGVSIGMRRQKQGAKASKKAAAAVNEYFRTFATLCRNPRELVHSALDYANHALEHQTNATTVVLAFINVETGACYTGCAGDSFIFLLRGKSLQQVNKTHNHPKQRNIITRKLGPDSQGIIKKERGDISSFFLLQDDLLVLATDGVEDVSHLQIRDASLKTRDVQKFAEEIVHLGEAKGDDRTIIAVRF
jgi:serine/threonine protein phosphatase PrpC